MPKEVISGLLIPFLGTSLGAGCGQASPQA